MSDPAEVWVVDDDDSIRWVLERALGQAGIVVTSFGAAQPLLDRLKGSRPDAIISDVRMPGMDGLELLERIDGCHRGLPVIVMTAYSDLESTVSAYRGGAFEYLPKPFDLDEVVDVVRRAIGVNRERRDPGEPADHLAESGIIGSAPAMQEVFRAIGRLSRSHITVLVTGESGSGKELVARALHDHGPRAAGPFIPLNTAAIPRELLESELFGHERGAFTGARARRRGRFEQADGGTLFLDEIGDMPAELQTRLLRVLADGRFYRVGGHDAVEVDVRIVAATHQDLEHRVRDGGFREDLFHRLNVIRVHVPALRERRDDIAALARHFLHAAARELSVAPKRLRPEAERHLVALDWPGNVRQLENTCRWLTVMAPGREVFLEDLPPELRSHAGEPAAEERWEADLRRWAGRRLDRGETGILNEALPRFEQVMIEVALRFSRGRRRDAAALLGWGRNTLTRKIKQHGMEDGVRKRETVVEGDE